MATPHTSSHDVPTSRKERVDKTLFDTDFFADSKIEFLLNEFGAAAPTYYLKIVFGILAEGGSLHIRIAKSFLSKLGATDDATSSFLEACIDIGLLYVSQDGKTYRSARADREIEALTEKREEWRKKQKKHRESPKTPQSVTKVSPESHGRLSVDSEEEEEKEQEGEPDLEVDPETAEVQEGARARKLPPAYHDDPATWTPFRIEAEEALSPVDDRIARSPGFVQLMRRPMKKYPELWLTGPELANVTEQILDAGITVGDRPKVFAKASALAKKRILEGREPSNLDAYSWLIGFAKREVIEELTSSNKLQSSELYVKKARKS